MKSNLSTDHSLTLLILQAQSLLEELETFLTQLPMGAYTVTLPEVSASTIGKHIRHSLDHFDSLKLGVSERLINYDDRPRDPSTETDASVAIQRIRPIKIWLLSLKSDIEVQVQSMTDPNPTHPKIALLRSTLPRELAFVSQHMIHHLSIVRILAGLIGVDVHENFGKAVSTVNFELRTAGPS